MYSHPVLLILICTNNSYSDFRIHFDEFYAFIDFSNEFILISHLKFISILKSLINTLECRSVKSVHPEKMNTIFLIEFYIKSLADKIYLHQLKIGKLLYVKEFDSH